MADTPRTPARSHADFASETRWQEASRRVAPIALLAALIAIGLAVWALMRAPSEVPTAAPPQGETKTGLCTAFATVSSAVQQQTFADLGPDPVAQKAVAGNARLALVGGGGYLLSRIGPDTPPDLAEAVRAFANNLQEIGMNALAEVPNTDPAQAARLAEGEASQDRITELCT